MPFDSTLPADHSPIVAAELRNQFNGLNDLIAAVPGQIPPGLTLQDVATFVGQNSAGQVYGIQPLNLTVSNPPTQAQMQTIADKIDEMLTAMKRQ